MFIAVVGTLIWKRRLLISLTSTLNEAPYTDDEMLYHPYHIRYNKEIEQIEFIDIETGDKEQFKSVPHFLDYLIHDYNLRGSEILAFILNQIGIVNHPGVTGNDNTIPFTEKFVNRSIKLAIRNVEDEEITKLVSELDYSTLPDCLHKYRQPSQQSQEKVCREEQASTDKKLSIESLSEKNQKTQTKEDKSLSEEIKKLRQKNLEIFLTEKEQKKLDKVFEHEIFKYGSTSFTLKPPISEYPELKYWYTSSGKYVGKSLPSGIKEVLRNKDKLENLKEISKLYKEYQDLQNNLKRVVNQLRRKLGGSN